MAENNSKYDNFVFYGGFRETLEGYREEFGIEYAQEVLWNIMLMATTGEMETKKRSIIGYINGTVMPTINKAKSRYKEASAGGAQGGRPRVELNESAVMAAKDELKTWKNVAAKFGVDEDTLRKHRKIWEENRKTEKPKNLDINTEDFSVRPEKPNKEILGFSASPKTSNRDSASADAETSSAYTGQASSKSSTQQILDDCTGPDGEFRF